MQKKSYIGHLTNTREISLSQTSTWVRGTWQKHWSMPVLKIKEA